jgi:hypothetical protein
MDLDEAGVISLDMISRRIYLQQQRQMVVQHHFPKLPVRSNTDKTNVMERKYANHRMRGFIKVCSPTECTRAGINKD